MLSNTTIIIILSSIACIEFVGLIILALTKNKKTKKEDAKKIETKPVKRKSSPKKRTSKKK